MSRPTWSRDLRGAALRIASADDPRLRVVAGPGTGKSFALKRRVARLLEQGQDPRRILAVTFTRTAAADILSDLRSLDADGSEKIYASTLHSYCFSLLNREDVLTLLDRIPRPVVTYMKSACLQFEASMLLYDLGLDPRFRKRRDSTDKILASEAAWARRQLDSPTGPGSEEERDFQRALESWLCFHRAILIGELVPIALQYLKNNPASRERSAFDHVLVDEYQDLNRAEQELLDELADDVAEAIIGDPNQSIYSFKYANPTSINDFSVRHPATRDESLDVCRRCPTRVVEMASSLISRNTTISNTQILKHPEKQEGEIAIVQWTDLREEAEGIANYVTMLVDQRGLEPQEVLVLCPRRELGYGIRNQLEARQIPVHSFFQEEVLDSESAQRAFALLTLLNDPGDRVALRWWLGKGSSTGRRGAYRRLRDYCEATGTSPWTALLAAQQAKVEIPLVRTHLLPHFEELCALLDHLADESPRNVIEAVFSGDDRPVRTLREFALEGAERSDDLSEIFGHVRTCVTQPEIPQGDVVSVMSLYKSKGLTKRAVIVTSCCEGLMPMRSPKLNKHRFAHREEELEEQRRLFYVAITRCEDILVLSSFLTMDFAEAMSMNARIRGERTIASRFLNELGPTAPAPRTGAEWQNSRFR